MKSIRLSTISLAVAVVVLGGCASAPTTKASSQSKNCINTNQINSITALDDQHLFVRISARLATGIDALLDQIKQLCGVTDFDLTTPVCFTERQIALLKRLTNTSSPAQACAIITQLLTAPFPV